MFERQSNNGNMHKLSRHTGMGSSLGAKQLKIWFSLLWFGLLPWCGFDSWLGNFWHAHAQPKKRKKKKKKKGNASMGVSGPSPM